MEPYRSCVFLPSTGCLIRDISGPLFRAPAFWWRFYSFASGKTACPKLRPRSTDLASLRFGEDLALRKIWLARMQVLMAQVRGDDDAYRDFRDSYRDMATSLGFEGHMQWGEAMA